MADDEAAKKKEKPMTFASKHHSLTQISVLIPRLCGL